MQIFSLKRLSFADVFICKFPFKLKDIPFLYRLQSRSTAIPFTHSTAKIYNTCSLTAIEQVFKLWRKLLLSNCVFLPPTTLLKQLSFWVFKWDKIIDFLFNKMARLICLLVLLVLVVGLDARSRRAQKRKPKPLHSTPTTDKLFRLKLKQFKVGC